MDRFFTQSRFCLMLLLCSMVFCFSLSARAETEKVYTPQERNFLARSMLNKYYRIRQSSPDEAFTLLKKITVKYPENQQAHLELAYAYIKQKNPKAALEQIQQAEKIKPVPTTMMLQAVYLLIETGNKQKAYERAEKLTHSPDKKIASKAENIVKNLKPSILAKAEEPAPSTTTQTTSTNEELIKKHPNNALFYRAKAYDNLKQKNYNNAIENFKKAQAIAPQEDVHLQMGYTYQQLKQRDQAIASFQLASRSSNEQIKQQADNALKNLTTADPRQAIIPLGTQPVKTLERDSAVASQFTKYYENKQTNPAKAHAILQDILKQDPNNLLAKKELSYIQLGKKQDRAALSTLLEAQKLSPQDENISLQIAYLYAKVGESDKALASFKKLTKSKNKSIREKSQQAIKNLSSGTVVVKFNKQDLLLNQFYLYRKSDPVKAYYYLKQAVDDSPKDPKLQKEMGYFLLANKQSAMALPHFLIAQRYQPNDYALAMQIGYIYDGLGNKVQAYQQFSHATKSMDGKISFAAHTSQIQIAPYRFTVMPDPWFTEFYFAPSYEDRFNDLVYPYILRVGRHIGTQQKLDIYGSIRATDDTRSIGGVSPDLIADPSYIITLGARFWPFSKIPLYLYTEYGKGYDLVDRNRPPWRDDYRGGLVYGQVWGAPLVYTTKVKMPFSFVNDAYADISYYTRFDNNTIGYIRMRPGLRVFEYHHTLINTYVKALYLFDTRHEFFNNLYELGPGIVVVPNNRLNLSFRLERVRGTYINVDSPTPNPFGRHYYNTRAEIEFYMYL